MLGILLLCHAFFNLTVRCFGEENDTSDGMDDSMVGSNNPDDSSLLHAAGGAIVGSTVDWTQRNPEAAADAAQQGLNFARDNPDLAKSAAAAAANGYKDYM